MKESLNAVLALTLAATIAGCGKQEDAVATNGASTKDTAIPAAETRHGKA
ncbi:MULTISPECIES: hypothetical protein [unclassified Sphingopyxis]|jgi:predicted small lipoprotein YifL|nr:MULTISPECIES: hypothetical protein [unclassified Sphingopyxis]MDT7529908.1 hypothetical protein [Sphingopyxis sp. SE2]